MSDYFLLEVYAHDLRLKEDIEVLRNGHDPYALAFQFLDYPLLLTYANGVSSFDSPNVIQFAAGKSCVLQEEQEELEYVLQKVAYLACTPCSIRDFDLQTTNLQSPMSAGTTLCVPV